MGKSQDKHFQNSHRVLNRAHWSALKASRLLLRLVVATFAPSGELIFGLDDTIERRRGEQIKARGIYRDPVRSSQSHFVKASGFCWLSCMLLEAVPWANAVWGLPVLTALCPSERTVPCLASPTSNPVTSNVKVSKTSIRISGRKFSSNWIISGGRICIVVRLCFRFGHQKHRTTLRGAQLLLASLPFFREQKPETTVIERPFMNIELADLYAADRREHNPHACPPTYEESGTRDRERRPG